ncbi:hypothetical protein KIN20_012559 [Parelaphostrongylus tenuis]|uniref:Uncharacterized protein n=1 Tax=Parelaphostrongylus tenuis TaxID=148309 RepID=A0AAD5MX47_PARTN|nr:hypothetical protein KIN20_012559 [Parelaphostrongylus tenuis]
MIIQPQEIDGTDGLCATDESQQDEFDISGILLAFITIKALRRNAHLSAQFVFLSTVFCYISITLLIHDLALNVLVYSCVQVPIRPTKLRKRCLAFGGKPLEENS